MVHRFDGQLRPGPRGAKNRFVPPAILVSSREPSRASLFFLSAFFSPPFSYTFFLFFFSLSLVLFLVPPRARPRVHLLHAYPSASPTSLSPLDFARGRRGRASRNTSNMTRFFHYIASRPIYVYMYSILCLCIIYNYASIRLVVLASCGALLSVVCARSVGRETFRARRKN